MITLKELSLNNYRNIKYQLLKFDGSSKVVGENRIGKTNTIEALYWLFTDKLLNGSKDIDQIKPLTDTKVVVKVSAIFDIDGKQVSLGKEYKEEWVKTRGTEDLVFKGHSTTYIYNGIKQGTKKEYDSLVATDFGISCKDYQGIDIMQLLVNPLYLGRMGDTDDWKNLRAMIIDIVGDVKDEDVLLSNPTLLPIKEDMERVNGRTDQMVKGYRDEIKSIKEDIIGADANIQLFEQTERPMDESIEIAKKGIEDCEETFRSLKVDGADDKLMLEIDKEIMDMKNQIIEIKRFDLEKKNADPNESARKNLIDESHNLMVKIDDIAIEREKLMNDKIKVNSERNLLDLKVSECQKIRHDLLDEFDVIKRQLENPQFEKECPHCHRPYDMDKIEENIAEVTKSLNAKKDTILLKGKENNETMQSYKDQIKDKDSEINRIAVDLSRLDDSAKILRSQAEGVKEKLKELEFSHIDEPANPQIAVLEDRVRAKELEKDQIRKNVDARDEKVRQQIADLQDRKERYQKVLDDYNYYLRMQEQIKSIKIKKEDLTKKLIRTEQKVELVKAFIKTKLEMLDENIKKVFVDVSFQLIEPQINGGYSTFCKPYIKGTHTLWKSGSKSEQVTTGVAICERIKAALVLPDFPYIFDEGGEISSDTFATRFDTKSQLICVQVKDGIMIPTVMSL